MSIFPIGGGDGGGGGGSGYRQGQTFYQTSGTAAIFTPSAGVTALLVKVYGATGGGGGVDGQGTGTLGAGAAGGNGGYAGKLLLVAGETFTYTIGAAGVGGAAGNNAGTSGGTTSFVGSVSGTLQVTGGGGGNGATGTAGIVGSLQGLAGVGSGGDTNYTANISFSWLVVSGIIYTYPTNGCPLFGFGRVSGTIGDGDPSGGLGAGGMGAFSSGTTNNYAGGNGFRGQIEITEFY